MKPAAVLALLVVCLVFWLAAVSANHPAAAWVLAGFSVIPAAALAWLIENKKGE